MTLDLTSLGDQDLEQLRLAIADEQVRRAASGGDLEALTEVGFARAFVKGRVSEPWMENGLLYCPGLLVGVGTLRHDCTFHRVGEAWSWESPDQLANTLRHVPYGSKVAQESLTLLAAPGGTEVTRVVMRFSGGGHRFLSSTTYVIHGDSLEIIGVQKGSPGAGGGFSH